MITSRDNEKLKLVRKLHERRWRDKLGLFFVEGEDQVEAATAEPVELLRAGVDVDERLLAEVSTAGHPPRVIAVYRRAELPGSDPRPVTLALWRVADPGNVGTLIRAADAFGAAIAVSEGCADATGPKAVRASAGSIWRVPVARFEASDTVSRGSKRVALVVRAGVALGDVALTDVQVTFLLGAEREGLPPEVARDVDAWIPTAGVESLNVAAAGAIALYEWRRQNP